MSVLERERDPCICDRSVLLESDVCIRERDPCICDRSVLERCMY